MKTTDSNRDQEFPNLATAGRGSVPGINKPEIADPDSPPKPEKEPNPLDEADGAALIDDDDDFEPDGEEEEEEEGEEDSGDAEPAEEL